MTYTARVTREDGWWMIRVPELDAITQAESLGGVEQMARDLVATILDEDPAAVQVEMVGPSARDIEDAEDEEATLQARADGEFELFVPSLPTLEDGEPVRGETEPIESFLHRMSQWYDSKPIDER